jgi:hypothetical protein
MKLSRGHFVSRNNVKPRCEFVFDKGINCYVAKAI